MNQLCSCGAFLDGGAISFLDGDTISFLDGDTISLPGFSDDQLGRDVYCSQHATEASNGTTELHQVSSHKCIDPSLLERRPADMGSSFEIQQDEDEMSAGSSQIVENNTGLLSPDASDNNGLAVNKEKTHSSARRVTSKAGRSFHCGQCSEIFSRACERKYVRYPPSSTRHKLILFPIVST